MEEVNKEVTTEETSINPNTIIVVNVSYLPGTAPAKKAKAEKLPEYFVLDIPPKILTIREKSESLYFDALESFAYNTVSRKTKLQVAHCQIYVNDDIKSEKAA